VLFLCLLLMSLVLLITCNVVVVVFFCSLYFRFTAFCIWRHVLIGSIGMGQFLLGSVVSWWAGGAFHSRRTARTLKARYQKEQKQLYTQYYNDVYKLSEQNQELVFVIEQLQQSLKQTEAKHELEALQRDYDEFKMPDIDGDDRISRAEFNMYVKNYLSNYPGLEEKDYPKFEDFDHDKDGFVR
jgi:hypothetical protein